MAVADAQDRYTGFEYARIDAVCVLGVDRERTTREDYGAWPALFQLGCADGARHDLGVDVGLAHPPGDQLGVLGPEIDH